EGALVGAGVAGGWGRSAMTGMYGASTMKNLGGSLGRLGSKPVPGETAGASAGGAEGAAAGSGAASAGGAAGASGGAAGGGAAGAADPPRRSPGHPADRRGAVDGVRLADRCARAARSGGPSSWGGRRVRPLPGGTAGGGSPAQLSLVDRAAAGPRPLGAHLVD